MKLPRPVLAALLAAGMFSVVVVSAIAATAATTPSSTKRVVTPAMVHAQFIAALAGPARASARTYRVPVSVTLAQAILESGWGASGLSTRDRNYFGIKCLSGVRGPYASGCRTYATRECGGGRCWSTSASFRVYRTLADSVADHGRFLVVNGRYATAFAYRNNPNQFAVRLQLSQYATSPTYAQNLQQLMRQYNLYRYDIKIP
ncbi:MAG TPA: sporangiospore maturation cell wall hydrolase GsmA [Rugosimonospora sp.]|nr:sporangiospore maturation cell wall hydrolase GsmA [Rugosimonospora sp.]